MPEHRAEAEPRTERATRRDRERLWKTASATPFILMAMVVLIAILVLVAR